MQIIFPKEAPEYSGPDLTLAFPAMIDGERVECTITAAALEDHFGAASPRAEDMLDAFDHHRDRIEAVARRLLFETRAQCLVLRSGYVRFVHVHAAAS
ncbi:MAG TPA: DUF1488 domain-containing protein [Paraburkholderia sp.]|jgi:hypothetical protein